MCFGPLFIRLCKVSLHVRKVQYKIKYLKGSASKKVAEGTCCYTIVILWIFSYLDSSSGLISISPQILYQNDPVFIGIGVLLIFLK